MNYWAAPGIKRTIVFGAFNFKAKKRLRENISICPNNGMIHFYQGAAIMVGIKIKDKINFLILGDSVFLYKSDNGVSIRIHTKRNLRTQARALGNFLRESMVKRNMNVSYSYKCGIRKTNNEFNGNQLFEITLPMKIKSAIKNSISN